ncbi:hypothetical protein DINM_020104 [Dirofilaria immitis]|nr:hypothetical protein [Dirofilaria immitis]
MKLVLIGSNDSEICEMEIHRDSQPISMLIPELCLSNDTIQNLDKYSNVYPDSFNQVRKIWQIRLRLCWDTIPDSRQKAFQQLLRTKPQLQWEAVPDLSFDNDDFLSPITIYPIMIQCSISPLSFKRTSAIVSFGPIGVFIPQFYFLENTLFSCCPVEATIAYANFLQRSAKKNYFARRFHLRQLYWSHLRHLRSLHVALP